MRKLFVALFAALFLIGGSASMIAAQSDATPATDAKTETDGSNPVDPEVGDTVTYYGEDGDAVGNVTITAVERGWEDYDEYSEPGDGNEYVAFTVVVESTIARGAIEVEDYDFNLQTASGYLWGTSYTSSETADPPLLEDTVSLATGDSEEFTIVFEVVEGEALGHLFWQPESGVLITAAQLEGE